MNAAQIYLSFSLPFHGFSYPNPCFCCDRFVLSTFSCHFRSRRESGESATFLLATMLTSLPKCVFEARFEGVSTRFGQRIVERCFENALGKIRSAFQNLRFGEYKRCKMIQLIVACYDAMSWFSWDATTFCRNFMLPKRRFWKAEPTFQSAFPREALFNVWSPKYGTHTLEKCFESAF